jgi:2-C-methyl-D-erythritol 4-phosphate cytidylyltransferase
VEAVQRIVVALPPGQAGVAGVVCVAGGETRSASVLAALEAAGEGDPVLVHDAARPLASVSLFGDALAALDSSGADAVVAAAPVTDTVKETDAPAGESLRVARTLDRSRLWAVQTPQVFRRSVLESVLRDASPDQLAAATDDAWLVEQAGGTVVLLPAPRENLKVTTPLDLRVAELLLGERVGP